MCGMFIGDLKNRNHPTEYDQHLMACYYTPKGLLVQTFSFLLLGLFPVFCATDLIKAKLCLDTQYLRKHPLPL